MLDGLYHIINELPFFHPVLVILAFFAGAQLPNVVRLCSALARLLRRFL